MREEKIHFRKNIVKQKLVYAVHVMLGSSALSVLEEKFDGKRTRVRPRRTWIDDVITVDACRRKGMMKLRDWLRTGTVG